MPSYSTPGIYVTESLRTSLVTKTSGPTAAVFFGEAVRGPVTPVVINDWATYKNIYGDLENAYDLGYAVFHFFANGGRSCYVIRVVNATATSSAFTSYPFFPTGVGNASAALFDAAAISPGTWGNTVTVETATGSIAPAGVAPYTFGSFTLVVKVGGVEVERWTDLSPNVNDNRYAPTVVNTYSRFITLSNRVTGAASAGVAYTTTVTTLVGGAQATVADSDYTTALTRLDALEGNLLLNAVGKSSSTVVSALVTKAVTRGDSFVIIDPLATDTTLALIQTTAANFSGLSSPGYAAQYVPRLLMIDPSKTGSGAVRVTYPGGAVAGLIVRTEIERSVAKAPAGYFADIRGALGIDVKLSDDQIGTLYDGVNQVNSFKAITGAGVVVYGARTLSRTQPDKFVSVRRTLNYLKASLKGLCQFAVFEPNNDGLWIKMNMTVSGFLTDFWRSGGLKGPRASDAFYVVCNSTNNPQSSIDQGIVNISVGVALQYPAEFIVINVSQWTGGSNAVESL